MMQVVSSVGTDPQEDVICAILAAHSVSESHDLEYIFLK